MTSWEAQVWVAIVVTTVAVAIVIAVLVLGIRHWLRRGR